MDFLISVSLIGASYLRRRRPLRRHVLPLPLIRRCHPREQQSTLPSATGHDHEVQQPARPRPPEVQRGGCRATGPAASRSSTYTSDRWCARPRRPPRSSSTRPRFKGTARRPRPEPAIYTSAVETPTPMFCFGLHLPAPKIRRHLAEHSAGAHVTKLRIRPSCSYQYLHHVTLHI